MADSKIFNLFPTPLWIVDLEPARYEPMNRAILSNLDRMMGPRPSGAPGGTLQTDNNLHEFDEFADITAHIAASVEAALKFLKIKHDHYLLTGCWANVNPAGGINTPHAHPNNYLSGVYYVQTQTGADSIFFSDPRPQASMISPPVEEESVYTGNEVTVDAKPGRLIVFPAWLMHGVPPNRSNSDRVSISFNAMFSQFTETMSKPKWEPTARLKRGGTSGDQR